MIPVAFSNLMVRGPFFLIKKPFRMKLFFFFLLPTYVVNDLMSADEVLCCVVFRFQTFFFVGSSRVSPHRNLTVGLSVYSLVELIHFQLSRTAASQGVCVGVGVGVRVRVQAVPDARTSLGLVYLLSHKPLIS